jgi:hypothetical protein
MLNLKLMVTWWGNFTFFISFFPFMIQHIIFFNVTTWIWVVTLDVFREKSRPKDIVWTCVRYGRPPRPPSGRLWRTATLPNNWDGGPPESTTEWSRRTAGGWHGGRRTSMGSLGCSTHLGPCPTDVHRPDNPNSDLDFKSLCFPNSLLAPLYWNFM